VQRTHVLEPVMFKCLFVPSRLRGAQQRLRQLRASPPPAGGSATRALGPMPKGSSGSTVNGMIGPRSSGGDDRRNREQVRGFRSYPADRLGGAQMTAELNTKPRKVGSTTSAENGSSTSNTRRSTA
jgi:hypothetical protein